MGKMTTTKEPAATGDLDFANECGVAEEGREVVLIGPSFPLSAQPRIDIANEKSPGSNTAELIFGTPPKKWTAKAQSVWLV